MLLLIDTIQEPSHFRITPEVVIIDKVIIHDLSEQDLINLLQATREQAEYILTHYK